MSSHFLLLPSFVDEAIEIFDSLTTYCLFFFNLFLCLPITQPELPKKHVMLPGVTYGYWKSLVERGVKPF